MKLKAGDRVRFLNEVGEGIITKILDDGRALVENSDGFELPVSMRELVPVSDNYERESKPLSTPKSAPSVRKEKKQAAPSVLLRDEEILLAFVPSTGSPELMVYLVNSSSFGLYYTVSHGTGKVRNLLGKGELEAGLKVYLGRYLPPDLNSVISFNIQAILYRNDEYIPRQPIHLIKNVHSTELFDGQQRVKKDYFDEKAYCIEVENFGNKKEIEPPALDAVKLRQAMLSKKTRETDDDEPGKKPSGIQEVDLHIAMLSDDPDKLTPAEILDMQLSRFRFTLESALAARQAAIVFIHGVGNGKLRYEIRKILDKEYRNLRYQDASFREYGYGATKVFLK